MKKNLKNWDKTKNLFLNWLSNSKIKFIFKNNFKYENLSLWWISNLTFKDSALDNSWYKNFSYLINKSKNINRPKTNKFEFFKLIKKFFLTIIFTLLCKLTFKKGKKNIQVSNCLLSFERNIVPYKKIYVERQYGLFQFQKSKDYRFLIFLFPNIKTIFNYRKKTKEFSSMNYDFSILNCYVSIFDIFRIYIFTFISFLKFKLFYNNEKYYLIKKINCFKI